MVVQKNVVIEYFFRNFADYTNRSRFRKVEIFTNYN